MRRSILNLKEYFKALQGVTQCELVLKLANIFIKYSQKKRSVYYHMCIFYIF